MPGMLRPQPDDFSSTQPPKNTPTQPLPNNGDMHGCPQPLPRWNVRAAPIVPNQPTHHLRRDSTQCPQAAGTRLLTEPFSQQHVRSSTSEDPEFVKRWRPGFEKSIRNWVLSGGDFLVFGSKDWPRLQSLAAAEYAPKVQEMYQYANFVRYKHRMKLAQPVPKFTSHRPMGRKAYEAMLPTGHRPDRLRHVHFNPQHLGPQPSLPVLLSKAAKFKIDGISLIAASIPENKMRSGEKVGGDWRFPFPGPKKGRYSMSPDPATGLELYVSDQILQKKMTLLNSPLPHHQLKGD